NAKWAVQQVLFGNDSILLDLIEINVRTTTDPYNGTSSVNQLNLFKQYKMPFTANLAMLHAKDPGGLGGVASTINGLCTENYKYAYADCNLTYSEYPTFSWDIEVLAHELAHLLSAWHTQSCHWP